LIARGICVITLGVEIKLLLLRNTEVDVSYLGIDAGSSYIKLWHEDISGSLITARNIHHRGSPRSVVFREVGRLLPEPISLSFSGNLDAQDIAGWHHEGLLAEIDYLRKIYAHRQLLIFGAEKIELVHFDDDGHILFYQTNPACAAGTGSFLDEQMLRLGLDFSDLPHIAIDEDAPMVATRCAVFAKTDLIHLQQDGHTAYSIYNGLCKGLVLSSLKSVFGGNLPDGSGILATGGLLENPHILHFLKQVFTNVTIANTPAFTRARGLCLAARLDGQTSRGFMEVLKDHTPSNVRSIGLQPLKLKKSTFPTREMSRHTDNYGNEIWHDLHAHEHLNAFIGVDIGSTSTKAALIDDQGMIRLDIYTKTSGNPIEATRRIFEGILSIQKDLPCTLTILGCATTGSGRKLVGIIIAADLIVNEITAHAKGALMLDDNVKTIFEIGGQDAKFIRIENGRIVDVNMNYVCAAGTGSFVEEQARTLDMNLDEIGAKVMGVTPLPNSDRCTVFMNQEITKQLSSGYPREQIMAGVLLAVFKNYVGKVVGNRSYNKEKIVFQGATARNKGLVAALEQITGAQVMVSPFCHVMGAYGAALLVKGKGLSRTSFRGLTIPEVSIKERVCKGCENTCRITVVQMDSEKTSWGYMCGREPGTQTEARKINRSVKIREDLLTPYRSALQKGKHVFKIPALGLYEEFIPLLTEIAAASDLGIEVCYPGKNEVQKELSSIGSGDFCYPIKVAMACVNVILKQDPACKILLPYLIQDQKDASIIPRSLFCPFITAVPAFFKEELHQGRLFTPVIDLSRSISWQAWQIRKFLKQAGIDGVNLFGIMKGIRRGMERLEQHRIELTTRARSILDEVGDEKTIVLLGRPYNLYHRILNLGIPELIESLGYKVITMDAVPDETTNQDVTVYFPDMYWYQGQRILKKAFSIRNKPNLFPLMISNFSCGPDSFILTYFEEICRGKPYLILELDEHGSATGYQTRIEAFIDMIEQHKGDNSQAPRISKPTRIRYSIEDIRHNTKIWIPQIHPYIPQLWSAVLNHYGYDTEAMGEETAAECAAGRALCRGSECLPTAVTTGKFLSIIKDGHANCHQALFMPRAEGPCRFGQYATLQSMIFERNNLKNAILFSPTSEDGYAFLTPKMEMGVWKAICLGDALYKLRCRVVPYHKHPVMAEALINEVLVEICGLISAGRDWKVALSSLMGTLSIDSSLDQPPKPLVGIVGEIFVRLNSFSNQHIVEAIEDGGGEAWLSPMTEWIYYVWESVAMKSGLMKKLGINLKKHILHKVEKDIMALFSPVLNQRHEPSIASVMGKALRFIPPDFEGEAILTIGRAKLFAEQGAHLVVNCSPFGCMPGRVTSHIFQTYRDYFQVPVVNLFFDGTGDISDQVGIYLKSITQSYSEKVQSTRRSSIFRRPGKNPAATPWAKVMEDSLQEDLYDDESRSR
jgi:predicted CoA-substrate-specific enzyme activase